LILSEPSVIWQQPRDRGKNRSEGKLDAEAVFRRSCCIEPAVLVLRHDGRAVDFYALWTFVVLEAVSS
jgi:hypothetical protein